MFGMDFSKIAEMLPKLEVFAQQIQAEAKRIADSQDVIINQQAEILSRLEKSENK